MFNLNNYTGKYVMHCKNEKEARSFCSYLHNQERAWRTGESYISYCYDDIGIQTGTICYDFNTGTYDEIDFYIRHNYIILEWSDFMNKKFTKEDLKTGMLTETDKGEFFLVLLNTEFGDVLKRIDDNGISTYWNSLDDFNNNLENSYSVKIINVYTPVEKYRIGFTSILPNSLVWTRNNTTELTITEIEEKLGIKNLKIVKEVE